jgi:hypothetical protein
VYFEQDVTLAFWYMSGSAANANVIRLYKPGQTAGAMAQFNVVNSVTSFASCIQPWYELCIVLTVKYIHISINLTSMIFSINLTSMIFSINLTSMIFSINLTSMIFAQDRWMCDFVIRG